MKIKGTFWGVWSKEVNNQVEHIGLFHNIMRDKHANLCNLCLAENTVTHERVTASIYFTLSVSLPKELTQQLYAPWGNVMKIHEVSYSKELATILEKEIKDAPWAVTVLEEYANVASITKKTIEILTTAWKAEIEKAPFCRLENYKIMH